MTNFHPLGKLNMEFLARLLRDYATLDERVVVGPQIGEDATVLDFGEKYLVAKTDPITFATEEIGHYAINVNANDLAVMGAKPQWFLATILLPERGTTDALVEEIFSQLSAACRSLDISFCGGHTEITYGLDRPIVVGQMLGEVAKDKLIRSSGAKVGDDIILTKGIPIEATAIIAREKEEELRGKFSPDLIQRCKDFLHKPGISILRDAQIATGSAIIHAMHDPTEGGLATGLRELALASKVGLVIYEQEIYILPESALLCRHFGLDPLGAIASGALLIALAEGGSAGVVKKLRAAGIQSAVIGRVLPKEEGMMLEKEGERRALPLFPRDEITKIFSEDM